MSPTSTNANLHRLLQRQLKRHGVDPDRLDTSMQEFLHIVAAAYHQFEDDYHLLEHSLELTSAELVDRNQQLRAEIDREEAARLKLEQVKHDLQEKYTQQTEEVRSKNERLRAEIQERERAQQSLQESEAWLLGMFNALDEAVVVFDRNNRVITINPAAVATLQYQADELAGKNAEFVYADPKNCRAGEANVQLELEAGSSFSERNVFRRKDGSTFPVQHTVSLLRNQDGEKLGMVCVFRDLTEQTRQEQIRKSVGTISEAALVGNSLHELLKIIHEQIGNLLDARNFFVSLYDSDREVYTVPYIVDQYDDYPEDLEMQGIKSVTDYVRRTGRPLLADSEALAALEDLGEVELVGTDSEHWMGVPMRTREGVIGVVVVQTYSSELHYSEDQFDLMIQVGQQIGYAVERKRAEQSLRSSERRNRAILDALPDLVFVLNRTGQIVDYHAPSPELLFVQPEVFLKSSIDEFMPQSFLLELHANLDAAMETGDIQVFEYQLSMNDRIRWFEGRLVRIDEKQALCVIRDRTDQIDAERERLELETQMQHTQKLESLGVLAGGIAHDFNNLLVGMLGNANLALARLQEDIPVQDLIERIQTAAMRAADLTAQMLAYSGKGSFVTEPTDLSAIIEEMGHLLGVSTSQYVTLVHEFAEDPVIIESDRAQIGQVAMNLITNASEAIGERSGTITVRTSVVDLNQDEINELTLDHDIEPGRYVLLEIEDDGAGMDADTAKRMFDPFFTTKFTGRGLGLAAVLGIVRSHYGAISVTSEPGVGTIIRVFFPPSTAVIRDEAPIEPVHDDTDDGGLVLLVDDDEVVREVAGMMLGQAGYDIVEARNGQEAVDIYKQRGSDIGLVVLDMTMPVMDGAETFRHLQGMDPSVRVLLSSGYTEQDATSRFDSGLAGFIQKPYQVDELLQSVRRAIATSGNSTPPGDGSQPS